MDRESKNQQKPRIVKTDQRSEKKDPVNKHGKRFCDLSVIVLTRNNERTIKQCLESVVTQIPYDELIIVDGHSTDTTLDIVAKYPRVRARAEGKRSGEGLFMAYHRQYELDVRTARIFNTYGPRLRSEGAYGRVVSRFITQALAGKSLTVYGNGMQTRSFCYITDTATGLFLLLTSERVRGEVVNIGNPEELTILKLAQRIKRLANSVSSIAFHPLPSDDPKRRCPNINKAQRLLKWKPKVSLEQGLVRTVTWFENTRMGTV